MNSETSEAGTTIRAFDLGKGSIGDPLRRRDGAARAVRCGDKFLHKASLLIVRRTLPWLLSREVTQTRLPL